MREYPCYGSMSVSPDGKLFAGETLSASVAVQSLEEGVPPVELTVKDAVPYCVSWKGDSNTLAVGYQDGMIRTWDVAKRKNVREFKSGFPVAVAQIAWSPDGKNLAANGTHGLAVWFEDKRVVLKGPSDSFCWSKTGDALVSVSYRGPAFWVYDTTTAEGKFEEVKQTQAVRVSCSSDGKHLALVYATDNTAATVDMSGKTVRTFGPDPGLPYNAEGHYRDPKGGRAEVVYVIQTEKGQEALTPAEFEKRTGWKNMPTEIP